MNPDTNAIPLFDTQHVYVDDATSGCPVLRFQRGETTIAVKVTAEAAEVLAEVLMGTAKASRVTGWGRASMVRQSEEIRGYLDAQFPVDGEPLGKGGVTALMRRILAQAPHLDPEQLMAAVHNRIELRRMLREGGTASKLEGA